MTTPIEKRNNNKFCEFHREVRHHTDECMHLKRQIEELIKVGKMSHVIKKLKQGNKKDQQKTAKKGEASKKEKAMEILMVQPWQRVATQRITQSFSPDSKILFPSLGDNYGTKGPMIIEAEIRDELCDSKITISMQRDHRKARSKTNPSSFVNGSRNVKIPSSRRQKKRSQAPERNKAIQEEVERLVEAGIMKEVYYHSWLNRLEGGIPLRIPLKMLPNAYKGYHQIKMAKEDEEKAAFITSQGIFRYLKMPFGLKNAEATYQCLVDKAFQKQIDRNLEGNKHEAESQKVHRRGGRRHVPGIHGKHKRNNSMSDKVEAVLSLPSPKSLKDVQKLNGKLASLNKFLAKSAEKSLPFFKTLKKCTKKSNF
ncbi:hypothetical protein Tco_0886419 [Tanacetum coccineum]